MTSYSLKTVTSMLILAGLTRSQSPEDKVMKILTNASYDNAVKPGMPVNIEVGVFISSVGDISETEMAMSMTVYIRQLWVDPRLSFQGGVGEYAVLTAKHSALPWVSDVFLSTAKSAEVQGTLQPNIAFIIYPNGTIIFSERVTARLSCPMDFSFYPMDRQTCLFKLESFAYSTREVVLKWGFGTPIEQPDELQLPRFSLDDITFGDCTVNLTTGSFPCIYGSMELRRRLEHMLLHTYVPMSLVVVLSWVSFWINVEATPARVSIGLMTVLTITTQAYSAAEQLPLVAYVKAIDVWVATDLFLVFSALLEFAAVNVLVRANTGDNKVSDVSATGEDVHTFSSKDKTAQLSNKPKPPRSGVENAKLLDLTCRFIYPIGFTVFNLVYWNVFLSKY